MRVFQSIFDRYPSATMDYIVRLFLFVGAWPLLPNEKNFYLRLVRVMPYLGLVSCFIHFLLICYNITSKLNNMLLLSEDVIFVIFLMKTVLRLLIGVLKNHVLVDCIHRLNGFTLCYKDEAEKTIFRRYTTRAQWFTAAYAFSRFIVNFIYTIEPLFEQERIFPGHTEFPFIPNTHDSPQYEFLYFTTIFMGLVVSGAIAAGDLFFVSTLIFLCCNYEILQHKLECTRELATKELVAKETPKSERVNFAESNESNHDESYTVSMDMLQDDFEKASVEEKFKVESEHQVGRAHQSDATVIMTTGMTMMSNEASTSNNRCEVVDRVVNTRRKSSCLIKKVDKNSGRCQRGVRRPRKMSLASVQTPVALTIRQRRGTLMEQKKDTVNVEMERHLDECIQYHLDIMSFSDTLHNEISELLFFEISVGSLLICVYMFQLSQFPIMSIKFAIGFSYLLLSVIQIFAFCWASSEISAESALVSDAMYFSDWLEASNSFKVKMRIIMSRSLKPTVVTAASFLPFNLELFTNMMNSAYSYYNIAMTMHEKK